MISLPETNVCLQLKSFRGYRALSRVSHLRKEFPRRGDVICLSVGRLFTVPCFYPLPPCLLFTHPSNVSWAPPVLWAPCEEPVMGSVWHGLTLTDTYIHRGHFRLSARCVMHRTEKGKRLLLSADIHSTVTLPSIQSPRASTLIWVGTALRPSRIFGSLGWLCTCVWFSCCQHYPLDKSAPVTTFLFCKSQKGLESNTGFRKETIRTFLRKCA